MEFALYVLLFPPYLDGTAQNFSSQWCNLVASACVFVQCIMLPNLALRLENSEALGMAQDIKRPPLGEPGLDSIRLLVRGPLARIYS